MSKSPNICWADKPVSLVDQLKTDFSDWMIPFLIFPLQIDISLKMGAKLVLLLQIHYSIPSTHWTMTETGKIEAQVWTIQKKGVFFTVYILSARQHLFYATTTRLCGFSSPRAETSWCEQLAWQTVSLQVGLHCSHKWGDHNHPFHNFRGQLDENNNLDVPDLESQLLKEVISILLNT